MRMGGDIGSHRLVTLQAGLVRVLMRDHLIRRAVVVVQRVAGETREFALGVTCRLDHAQVFIATGPCGTVMPVTIGIVFLRLLQPKPVHGDLLFQILSGAEVGASHNPVRKIGFAIVAVALSTDLTRKIVGERRRVDDWILGN